MDERVVPKSGGPDHLCICSMSGASFDATYPGYLSYSQDYLAAKSQSIHSNGLQARSMKEAAQQQPYPLYRRWTRQE